MTRRLDWPSRQTSIAHPEQRGAGGIDSWSPRVRFRLGNDEGLAAGLDVDSWPRYAPHRRRAVLVSAGAVRASSMSPHLRVPRLGAPRRPMPREGAIIQYTSSQAAFALAQGRRVNASPRIDRIPRGLWPAQTAAPVCTGVLRRIRWPHGQAGRSGESLLFPACPRPVDHRPDRERGCGQLLGADSHPSQLLPRDDSGSAQPIRARARTRPRSTGG